MAIRFTLEEWAEMAAADAEIEATPITDEEVKESIRRDREISFQNKDNRTRKIVARQRRYREAHREQFAGYQRRYREAHREQLAGYQRRYREAHREQLTDYQRRYREAHREQLTDYQRRYREARKKGEGNMTAAHSCRKEDHRWKITIISPLELSPTAARPKKK